MLENRNAESDRGLLNYRLYIVDPSLKSNRGHHYNLTKIISDAAIQKNISVRWLVNRELDALNNDYIDKIFTYSMYPASDITITKTNNMGHGILLLIIDNARELYNKIKQFVPIKIKLLIKNKLIEVKNKIVQETQDKSNHQQKFNSEHRDLNLFAKELFDYIKTHNLDSQCQLYLHTTEANIYRSVLQLHMIPEFYDYKPVFHLSTPYNFNYMPMKLEGMKVLRVMDYYKKLGLIGENIFLYAETGELANLYSNETGIKFKTMPLPAVPIENYMDKKRHKSKSEKYRIGFLGAIREEKGFKELIDVIDAVVNDEKLSNYYEFVVHKQQPYSGYSKLINDCLVKLDSSNNAKNTIKYIEGELTANAYYTLLSDIDIIWAFYNYNTYNQRGSGLFIDAVSCGIPVIVNEKIAISNLYKNPSVLEANDVDQIVDILHKFIQKSPDIREAAKSMALKYREENSPERYISRIEDNIKIANANMQNREIHE